jgi:hypothetical protein
MWNKGVSGTQYKEYDQRVNNNFILNKKFIQN